MTVNESQYEDLADLLKNKEFFLLNVQKLVENKFPGNSDMQEITKNQFLQVID